MIKSVASATDHPRPTTYDLVEQDFPEWSGPPRRTLLLCTHPRSGSTMLGEALLAGGSFGCPMEYFHRGFQPAFVRRWRTDGFPDYLRAVYRHRTDPSGTLGVKIFWRDLEELAVTMGLGDAASPTGLPSLDRHRALGKLISELFPNPVFVHLVRQDPLRQAVSSLIASDTAVWRSIPGAPAKAPAGVVRYDYQRIAELMASGEYCRESWAAFFAANNFAFHRVAYEDLAGNFEVTVRTLFSALGRPDAPVRAPRLRRQADRTSEELVRRFLDEMRARTVAEVP